MKYIIFLLVILTSCQTEIHLVKITKIELIPESRSMIPVTIGKVVTFHTKITSSQYKIQGIDLITSENVELFKDSIDFDSKQFAIDSIVEIKHLAMPKSKRESHH